MAIDLNSLRRVRATDPARIVLYGPPGIGKTTLASEWPDPVFIQTEDGLLGDVELTTFGHVTTYDAVMGAISALYTDEHSFKTLVIDSLDKLEPMVWQKACADNHWASIETPGYGKGYLAADQYWRDAIDGANALRRDKKMNIIYIAHSTINTIDDPMTQSYSRYDIRLQKRAIGIFQDEADCIFFLNQDITIKSDGDKYNTRTRADGGGNRWLYTAPRPAFVAKNRYGIPDRVMLERGRGHEALAGYFPAQASPEKKPAAGKKSAA